MHAAPWKAARVVIISSCSKPAACARSTATASSIEVMVDFWSNHFNIFAAKGADRWLTTAYDRDTIRPHALGKFQDLLLATAQSPAMLFYLDNWLSASPDSPGAQIGRAEQSPPRSQRELRPRADGAAYRSASTAATRRRTSSEVARCFTGWTIRPTARRGEFRFEPRIHDNGEKIVLAHAHPGRRRHRRRPKGHRYCWRAIRRRRGLSPTKLARRFVADESARVDRRAKPRKRFAKATAISRRCLRTIIDSPEFFAPEVYQAKIKKPFEFVASALRVTGRRDAGHPSIVALLGPHGRAAVFGPAAHRLSRCRQPPGSARTCCSRA